MGLEVSGLGVGGDFYVGCLGAWFSGRLGVWLVGGLDQGVSSWTEDERKKKKKKKKLDCEVASYFNLQKYTTWPT